MGNYFSEYKSKYFICPYCNNRWDMIGNNKHVCKDEIIRYINKRKPGLKILVIQHYKDDERIIDERINNEMGIPVSIHQNKK